VAYLGKSVAVVVPALDEEASIARVVADFRARPEVDLVFVVDNGSRDRTAERAAAAGARVVAETRRGYGAALRRGIEEALAAEAALIVLCEADGTFAAEELERLLAPLDASDLVLGSRAADLPGVLGLGNRLVACFLSALWPRASIRLSDVGCTYRAFTAATWRTLAPEVDADGPAFSPQMMCAAFRTGLRVRELPVRYGARTAGSSKHTGDVRGVLRTARAMVRAIVRERFRRTRA
jgi:glycosyltransferase involved in cell wall biosynthesis